MSEGIAIPFNMIELLNDKNYHVWALKIGAVLRARKLFREVLESAEPPVAVNPDSPEGKAGEKWEVKNDEAFGIIITTVAASTLVRSLLERPI